MSLVDASDVVDDYDEQYHKDIQDDYRFMVNHYLDNPKSIQNINHRSPIYRRFVVEQFGERYAEEGVDFIDERFVAVLNNAPDHSLVHEILRECKRQGDGSTDFLDKLSEIDKELLNNIVGYFL